uniref:Uncharacterized protein n=1 Tax=Chelydra serpentina TaxID=8475 RepID=A0A8C3SUY5_CHESE
MARVAMSCLDYLAAECLVSISSGALIHPAAASRPGGAGHAPGRSPGGGRLPGAPRVGALGEQQLVLVGRRGGPGERLHHPVRRGRRTPVRPTARPQPRPLLPGQAAPLSLPGLLQSLWQIVPPEGASEDAHR